MPQRYTSNFVPGENDLLMSGREPSESERHLKQMFLLIQSLERSWSQRQDFYIGGNMSLYFSEEQLRSNRFRAPDLFVVLGTQKRERQSWVVWQENGTPPTVVVELISPATEIADRGERMHIYAQVLQVPGYYLFDPFTAVLEGYALDSAKNSYAAIKPFANGDLPCPWLQLRLGIRAGVYLGLELPWLRWLTDDGGLLPADMDLALEAKQRILSAKSHRLIDEQSANHVVTKLTNELIDSEEWAKGAKKRLPTQMHKPAKHAQKITSLTAKGHLNSSS